MSKSSKTTAEVAGVEEPAEAADPPTEQNAAREAELARQAEIIEAVAAAAKNELPHLGGDILEPGLGR